MIRVFPVAGAPRNVCAGYGNRTYPDGSVKLHDAVDLCAPLGTPVVAVDDGTVSWGTDPFGGNVAVLRTPDGNGYYTAHLLDAQSGSANVVVGQQIGRVDTTGNASLVGISHVHFQVWPGGQFNPGTVHPDPTADLMAAPILPAPVSAAPASNLARAIIGGVAILGAASLAAWAILEHRRRGSGVFSRHAFLRPLG